jgi:2-polyprenyl-6-methoxyphenol hydroxylase-like FAD-dependent oxidoreductase
MYASSGPPVAVIGGGPVGLAAAAHLLSRGLPVKLYEAGETVASNVLKWSHVRLFSPWCFNIDEVARALLREQGWQEPPANDLPTGRQLYDAYLAPLGGALMAKGIIETRARVRWISRRGIDKVVSRDRADHHFCMLHQGSDSRCERSAPFVARFGSQFPDLTNIAEVNCNDFRPRQRCSKTLLAVT